MTTLKHAHSELFRRTPDETFRSFDGLLQHCQQQRETSVELWYPPAAAVPQVEHGSVSLHLGDDRTSYLNHWSFSQYCATCGVNRETLNRLRPETASQVLSETRPSGSKPLQFLSSGDTVRSLHGTQYSRLWNADLLQAVREAAPDFQPPQRAVGEGTGLYAGEEDMFCFLIDPAGWCDIGDQHFAPGFFVWNSEVGRRSLGVQTFWFQMVCCNHIVWDAVEVVELKRRHTGRIADSLDDVQRVIRSLVARRDERRDAFASVLERAMQERVASSGEEATRFLTGQKISRKLVSRAVESLSREGKPFTLWTLVDVLTQLSQDVANAGERTELDLKIAKLLSLAV